MESWSDCHFGFDRCASRITHKMNAWVELWRGDSWPGGKRKPPVCREGIQEAFSTLDYEML
jgi:hypothetical protein